MGSGMKELLITAVRPLVSHPDAVMVSEFDQGGTIVLELRVDSSDMGKVIGKQGRRAQALRSVIKARAARLGKRVIVDIV